jgi:hypothetical protein
MWVHVLHPLRDVRVPVLRREVFIKKRITNYENEDMKYVIFKDTVSGLIQPVLFGDHTKHSQILLEGSEAVSAGFF